MGVTTTKPDASVEGMSHTSARHDAEDLREYLGAIDSGASKRQKVAHGESMNIDTYDEDKNVHLRGRRRFEADLEDLQALSAVGYATNGLRLKSIEPGEDDGGFTVDISNAHGKHVLTVNFLVSDTSDYPSSHSMFCHSLDPDISARLEAAVERVVDQRAQPMKTTIDSFFSSVSAATAPKATIQVRSDTEDDDSEEDEYDYDNMDDIGSVSIEPKAVRSLLQTNFLDIVASSYKPGLTRVSGGDDLILSVSVPVITLASSIPPRALMAWDRRLLSESHNLVLLISGFRGIYPVLENDGTYTSSAQKLSVTLSFKVGLSPRYKPGHEHAREAVRKHGLVVNDAEDELRIMAEKAAQERLYEYGDEEGDPTEDEPMPAVVEEEVVADPERFDTFSLSSSLESLIDQAFLRVVQFRRKFGLGWAGAEVLYHETDRHQRAPEEVLAAMLTQVTAADKNESQLARTLALPRDPFAGLSANEPINLPLTAFSYLIRRLTLCTKYCIVCHNTLNTDYEALKPYVCDSKLCSYQYYSLNRGPSLEYEIIHNTNTVDLLVSLAYASAMEGAMEDPLPVGMGLRVPDPGQIQPGAYTLPVMPVYDPHRSHNPATPLPESEPVLEVGKDGLVDFDVLNKVQMRAAIAKLIEALPSIDDMKKHLERKVRVGKSKPKLRDIDPSIHPAGWLVLRWIVCSCTAYIEEITSGGELIQDLDRNWRQFRLTVGAPDAEAKFQAAVNDAVRVDANAKNFPALYAFHGSPLRNWHSIVRHGLWYKSIAHGRAYGNGVYLAKDANISMMGYAAGARSCWKNSQTSPVNCVALAEVVNLPRKFVSSDPYFVIADTHWIMCRYLLIKGSYVEPVAEGAAASASVPAPAPKVTPPPLVAPNVSSKAKKNKKGLSNQKEGEDGYDLYVKLDPAHATLVGGKIIQIPDPARQLETILALRQEELVDQDFDEEDMGILTLEPSKEDRGKERGYHHQNHTAMDIDEEDDYRVYEADEQQNYAIHRKPRPKDDWVHDAEYVEQAVADLMLPPFESSGGATVALQKELRAMQREQDTAMTLKELGWYMPPEFMGDNLYQWIVEMHSFDPDIPIAMDMKKQKVNSVIFEIRFPPTFPIAPPFFRIITPRFLPFIQGGGGHVTGGGSICMDLLTWNGWLPSYTIPAILVQIKLAISNLDPKPARLASNWKQPYAVSEALAGFRRAAATHGWTVPEGLDRLVS